MVCVNLSKKENEYNYISFSFQLFSKDRNIQNIMVFLFRWITESEFSLFLFFVFKTFYNITLKNNQKKKSLNSGLSGIGHMNTYPSTSSMPTPILFEAPKEITTHDTFWFLLYIFSLPGLCVPWSFYFPNKLSPLPYPHPTFPTILLQKSYIPSSPTITPSVSCTLNHFFP